MAAATQTQIAYPAWCDAPHVQRWAAHAQALGMPWRFVGGCVRDTVLGRGVGDLDACSPWTPQQMTQACEGIGLRVIPTGVAHGTVTVMIDTHPIQITTLRRDVACDGRHAQVAFTQEWQEDALRRDFTMNGLMLELQPHTRIAYLYDLVDGLEDAVHGRVRFIGDARTRIAEDHLRILRFFRFVATHGQGEPDAAALQACAALREGLQQISGERIQTEMLKLLGALDPCTALEAMVCTGVLAQVMPQGLAGHVMPRMPALHALVQMGERGQEALLRLAVIGQGCENALWQQLAARWKLSRQHSQTLARLSTAPSQDWDEASAKVALATRERLSVLQGCLRDHALAHKELPQEVREVLQYWQPPRFPLSGDDLLVRGVPAGRELGALLALARSHWAAHAMQPDKQALLSYLAHHHPLS